MQREHVSNLGGQTVVLFGLLLICPWMPEDAQGEEDNEDARSWSFERVATGEFPDGWQVEATRQKYAGFIRAGESPLATWEVTEDSTAPDGKKVLALSSPNHESRGTFNLCWTDTVSFLDGEISVKFKANTGVIDQGGGPIWRAKDNDNYYVCRANPLESNLRLYYVKDGGRTQLDSATTDIPSGQWHEVKIKHAGNHIECYLNEKKLLDVDDETFTEPGGVGLWTKADAATSFDEFEVEFGE